MHMMNDSLNNLKKPNRENRQALPNIKLPQESNKIGQPGDRKQQMRQGIGKKKANNNLIIFDEYNTPVEYMDEKLQVKQISKQLICISPVVKQEQQPPQQIQQNVVIGRLSQQTKAENLSTLRLETRDHLIEFEKGNLDDGTQFNNQTIRKSSADFTYLKTEQTDENNSVSEERPETIQYDDSQQLVKQNQTNEKIQYSLLMAQTSGDRMMTKGSEGSHLGSTQTLPKFGQYSYHTTSDTHKFKTGLNKSNSDQRLNFLLNQSTKIESNKSGIGLLNSTQNNMSTNNMNKSQDPINISQFKKNNTLKSIGKNQTSALLLNQSELSAKNKPSSMLQKIQMLQTNGSFSKRSNKEFSDVSHIEQHFTNILDYPRCQEKIYDSILLSPKEIQSMHKARLNKDKFWIKMALGNKKISYQADLKKIKENRSQCFVSDSKQIDPVRISLVDPDGDKFKQEILNVHPLQKQKLGSTRSIIVQNGVNQSVSPNRRFSDSFGKTQKQFIPQDQNNMNADQNAKHFQSVKDKNNQSNNQLLFKNTTSRHDVQELETWLEQMLQSIYLQNDQSADQVLGNVQLIYTACLKELIRQVSLQCTERGLLIQKVWDAYLNMFERMIEQFAREKRQQEQMFLDDVTRISKGYQMNVNLMNKDLEEMKKNMDQLNKQLEQALSNNAVLKDISEKHQQDIKLRDSEIETLKQNIKVLAWDNHYYQIQFENQIQDKEKLQQVEKDFYKRLKMMENEEEEWMKKTGQNNDAENKVPSIENEWAEGQKQTMKLTNRMRGIGQKEPSEVQESSQLPHIHKKNKSKTLANLDYKSQINVESLVDFKNLNLQLKRNNCTDCETQTEELENTAEYSPSQREDKSELEQKKLNSLREQIEQELREKIQNELTQKLELEMELKHKSSSHLAHDKHSTANKDKQNKPQPQKTMSQLQQQIDQFNLEKQKLKLEIQQQKASYEDKLSKKDQEIKSLAKQEELLQGKEEQLTEREKSVSEKERMILEKEKNLKEKELGFQIKQNEFISLEENFIKQNQELSSNVVKIEGSIQEYIHEVQSEQSLIAQNQSQQKIISNHNLDSDKEFVNQSDWKSIYKSMVVNPNIPSFVKQNIDRILLLLNTEKDSQIQTMQTHHEKKLQEIKEEESAKRIDSARSSSSNNENDKSVSINEIPAESKAEEEHQIQQKELEDAKLEIEEYKDNVNDLTNKNSKLINKVKQLKVIIRSQKNTIVKIQDIAKQLLAENKKSQLAQSASQQDQEFGSPSVSISEDITTNQFSIREDTKYNEPDSLSIIEFVPIDQPLSSPNAKNKLTSKNINSKNTVYSKKNVTKATIAMGEKSPPLQANKQNSAIKRVGKLDNLLNQLDDLAADIIMDDSKEEDDFDEYFPQINNVRKTSLRVFTNKFTQAHEFKLGQINKKDRTISVNAESALKLLVKVQERIKDKKHQISQMKNNVIKFIINVYVDRIKNPQNIQNPLYVIAYDNMMQKYGLKKVAETKLQQFLESSMKYLDNSRIKMFSRFIKIHEPYENQDYDLYIKCLKLIDETGNNGVVLISQPSDRILVSYVNWSLLKHQFF